MAEFAGLEPIVVITGGSRGIGLALARQFVSVGQRVLLVARSPEQLAQARAGFGTSTTNVVHTLALDLTAAGSIDALEAELARLGCYCDIAVNNAGLGLGGPLVDQPEADLGRLIDLNIRALTQVCRRLLPDMLARGRGGILNVASLGGLVPGPHQAAYYASKAYVISLTEALALETRGHGVTISALAPGPVATGFHRAMGAEQAYYLKLFGRMDVDRVALSAIRGFRAGRVLIVPGWLGPLYAVALRVIPHTLSGRMMALLLKRR